MSQRIVYELTEENFRVNMRTYGRKNDLQTLSGSSRWSILILPSLLVGCIGHIIAKELSLGNETNWTFGGIFFSAVLITVFAQKFQLDSYIRRVIRSRRTMSWDNILCRTEVILEADRVRCKIPTCETAYVFKYISRVDYKEGILHVLCKNRTILFINKETIISGDLDAFAEALSEAVKNAKDEPTEIGK